MPLFFFSLAKKYALSCPSRSTGTWAWNSSASCANAKARNQTRRMSRSRAKTTTWLGGALLNRRQAFSRTYSYECKGPFQTFANVQRKGGDVNDDDEDTPMVDRRMLNSASSSFVHAGVKRVFVTRGPEVNAPSTWSFIVSLETYLLTMVSMPL